MNESLQKDEKNSGSIKKIRKDLSIFGGARSLISQVKQGGGVIGDGVRDIANATKKSFEPGRYESFDQAMARLGVDIKNLPIIHNQLVIQVYLTFFVGCLALSSSANLLVQEGYLASLVAFFIAVASFSKMIQSSMQCEFIRERRLGISTQWLSKPHVWLPNRIEGLVRMEANDPLRDARIVSGLARASRRHLKFSVITMFFGLGSYFIFGSWGWPLVSMSASVVFMLLGATLSFEVYKRREGVVCDLYPWLSDFKSWAPAIQIAAKLDPAPLPQAANDADIEKQGV